MPSSTRSNTGSLRALQPKRRRASPPHTAPRRSPDRARPPSDAPAPPAAAHAPASPHWSCGSSIRHPSAARTAHPPRRAAACPTAPAQSTVRRGPPAAQTSPSASCRRRSPPAPRRAPSTRRVATEANIPAALAASSPGPGATRYVTETDRATRHAPAHNSQLPTHNCSTAFSTCAHPAPSARRPPTVPTSPLHSWGSP